MQQALFPAQKVRLDLAGDAQDPGEESLKAVPSGVRVLSAAGPVVLRQTPTAPLSPALAYPSAMKAAPCSWRALTWHMGLSSRAS